MNIQRMETFSEVSEEDEDPFAHICQCHYTRDEKSVTSRACLHNEVLCALLGIVDTQLLTMTVYIA